MLPPSHQSRRPRATEAATAAPRRVAGAPTHGYALTREAAMAAFAKELAVCLKEKPRSMNDRRSKNFPVSMPCCAVAAEQ
jgi:hypothetical protein